MPTIFTQQIDRQILRGEIFTSERFSSTAELLAVSLTGCAAAPVTVTVRSHRETGGTDTVCARCVEPDAAGRVAFTCRFDPVHLAVYKDAVAFSVTASAEAVFALHALTVAEEMAAMATSAVQSISRVVRREDGTAFVPVWTADAGEIFVPALPKKVLLAGNSLLLGLFLRYGMCASSPRHDYAYYIETALRARQPSLTVTRIHGAGFECLEDPALFEKWFDWEPNPATGRPTCEAFTADTDLIVIQLGDNVNTETKKRTFPETAPRLMKKIRTLCPRARVVWVYGWYNKSYTHDALMSLCDREQIEWVDISGLRGSENEAVRGQVLEHPDGGTVIADDRWITHPGNRGMQRIAQAILGVLGIASAGTEEGLC